MGLFDILRGQREPKRANLDRLFAMSTAVTTITVDLGLRLIPRAAVCFKPVEAGAFGEMQKDIDEILEIASRDTGTAVDQHDDQYGFRWVVLQDPDFDDLVTTVHLINQTIEERGFADKLLCSVFGFTDPGAGGQPVYFVYAYKRGTFYPFAPRGENRRDNAVELRLSGSLARELPMEPELERWYPVWGVPVAPEG